MNVLASLHKNHSGGNSLADSVQLKYIFPSNLRQGNLSAPIANVLLERPRNAILMDTTLSGVQEKKYALKDH